MSFTKQPLDGRYPYVMSIDDLPEEIKKKAYDFAVATEPNTVYSYGSSSKQDRIDHIYYGKLGEEVFAKMMKEQYGLELPIDYRIYPGYQCDEYDFAIEDIYIDVKISFLKERHSPEQAHKSFNFILPEHQTLKDVLVYGLLSADKKTIVLTSWTTKGIFLENSTLRKQENVTIRQMPFKKGFDLKELSILSKDLVVLENIHPYFSPEVIELLVDDEVFYKIFVSQSGSQEEYDKFKEIFQKQAELNPDELYNDETNVSQILNYSDARLVDRIDTAARIKLEETPNRDFYKKYYDSER